MSDKRLAAALAKIDSESDGETLTAARMATKMLKDRGLSWSDVAELITSRSLGEMMAPAGKQNVAAENPFADIFSNMGTSFSQARADIRRQAEKHPEKPFRSVFAKIVQGKEIPRHIYGTLKIADTVAWNDKVSLIVNIETMDGMTTYGPMRIFDEKFISWVSEAVDSGNDPIVTANVRHSDNIRHLPVINHMSMDGFSKK